jgi:hypothetical protein
MSLCGVALTGIRLSGLLVGCCKSSGAIHMAGPLKLDEKLSSVAWLVICLHNPNSDNLIWPVIEIKIFSGLTSPWTSLCEWM